jgi:hypothetical protein
MKREWIALTGRDKFGQKSIGLPDSAAPAKRLAKVAPVTGNQMLISTAFHERTCCKIRNKTSHSSYIPSVSNVLYTIKVAGTVNA